ncbi:hypothetical protein HK105_206250 [Polyrhizophydium stewartii]|uniref:carbonic anhydrase n=1 Tax=Polyrhizophydium stewartii TaxID=2732419 RepID=A0ABR4N438_9FUNG|nr:hypothetical protein HK105_001652 [Polyrhizophydium stewartii]
MPSLAKALVAGAAMLPLVFAYGNCLADVIVADGHRSHLYAREGAGAQDWGYEAEVGSAFWAALDPAYVMCARGKHQSPINFHDVAMLNAQPLQFDWETWAENVSFVNNGHTIQANIPADAGFSLSPPDASGSGAKYTLAQFHLHSPSEHHHEERAFALEAHFVHTTPDKKIAVLGVWFELCETGSSMLDSLLAHGAPKGKGTSKSLSSLDLSEVHSAITAHGAKFWSYAGSLTTPPCSESVKWSVLAKPLPISISQLREIHEAMPFNARMTAPQGSVNSPTLVEDKGSESESHGHAASVERSADSVGVKPNTDASHEKNPSILTSTCIAMEPNAALAIVLSAIVLFFM